MSSVAEEGTVDIQAKPLDGIILEPVSYIKMDIEGSEFQAIKGLRETIIKYHPRLAVSVYHKTADFIDIPNLVMSIRKDYNIYLRHYKESFYDTVMFFVPKY